FGRGPGRTTPVYCTADGAQDRGELRGDPGSNWPDRRLVHRLPPAARFSRRRAVEYIARTARAVFLRRPGAFGKPRRLPRASQTSESPNRGRRTVRDAVGFQRDGRAALD